MDAEEWHISRTFNQCVFNILVPKPKVVIWLFHHHKLQRVKLLELKMVKIFFLTYRVD